MNFNVILIGLSFESWLVKINKKYKIHHIILNQIIVSLIYSFSSMSIHFI